MTRRADPARPGRRTLRIAIACAALAASAVAAANVIVIRSSGPAAKTYPSGRTLPDNASIRLGSGESVTILGPQGSRVFRGPGTFSPADPVRAAPQSSQQRPGSGVRVGGVRMSSLEIGRRDGPSVLVTRANGPSARSFPPGRALPAASRLNLRTGDVIVIVDPQGTRTLRGPGVFTAGRAAPVRPRTGTLSGAAPAEVRGFSFVAPDSAVAGPPSIWTADATSTATICFVGNGPVLMRPDAAPAATLSITSPDAETRRIDWPAGASRIDWPADFAVAGDGDYRLRLGGGEETQLRLRRLEAEPGGLDETAAAFIARDCQTQLDRLLDGSPSAGATAATGITLLEFIESAAVIHPARGGTICLAEGMSVAVARAEGTPTRMRVTAAGRREANLEWPGGAPLAAWPADLPTADGATYRVGGARVVFRHLPGSLSGADADDPVALAAALLERGCDDQLEDLVAATAAGD